MSHLIRFTCLSAIRRRQHRPLLASSSSPTFRSADRDLKEFDVFVSYRGKDVAKKFLSHFINSLSSCQINCFRDNNPATRGQDVETSIFNAIPSSKAAIVILSKNFAESRWCLDELVQIRKLKRDGSILFLQVFFGVSVEDVKRLNGKFGEGFQRLMLVQKGKADPEANDNEKDWKDAMTEATKCSGFDLENDCNGDESALIDKMLGWLSTRGIPENPDHYQSMGKNVVGRDEDASKVISICSNIRDQNKASVLIGIHGMEGIGTTSVVKLVVSLMYHEFDLVCFLDKVRDQVSEEVVDKLLKAFQTGEQPSSRGHHWKISRVIKNLRHWKSLLVLDGVDNKEKVDEVLRDRRSFHHESVIIVTARDEELLNEIEVDQSYMVSALDSNGSLQLFSRCVFNTDEPQDEFRELSLNLCHYAGGLPKEIKKLGSHIRRYPRDAGGREVWEKTLEKLERNPCIDCVVSNSSSSRVGSSSASSRSGRCSDIRNQMARSETVRNDEYGPGGHIRFVLSEVENYGKNSLLPLGVYNLKPTCDHSPFKKIGPFLGGLFWDQWDDGQHKDIRKVEIFLGGDSIVEGISTFYCDNGRPTEPYQHGKMAGGKVHSVNLDPPFEYLKSITGYRRKGNSYQARISSITLTSNLAVYGPFGTETGQQFSFPAMGGKIIGFHGTTDLQQRLHSVGVYNERVSHIYPLKKFGPFGSERYGIPWDGGHGNNLKRVTIKFGQCINSITFDYHTGGDDSKNVEHGGQDGEYHEIISLDHDQDEFFTSFGCHIAEGHRPFVNSLILKSNRRTWGPYGTEEGTYFSLPQNSGKIVGFYGRTDGRCLTSIGAYVELYSKKQYPFKSVGSFGGEYGESWDDGIFKNIRKIEIVEQDMSLKSIRVDYETSEGFLQKISHGPNKINGKIHTVTLAKDEHLTSYSGYIDASGNFIRSLAFQSNKRSYGLFGPKMGKYFCAPATGGKITGFYGRKNNAGVIAIGAHFEPISNLYPSKRIGPFGRQGGDYWCDSKSDVVKKVEVVSDKEGIVRIYALYERNGESFCSGERSLGYAGSSSRKVDTDILELDPKEYLTAISGYIRDDSETTIVWSIVFHTNKGSYGPYGKKQPKGTHFWFPSTEGNKVTHFFGYKSSSHLISVGVYMEPISDLPPFKSIGPYGGRQGRKWDDGTYTDIREVCIEYGSSIASVSVEYDNNGSAVQCPVHGNDRSCMATVEDPVAEKRGLKRSMINKLLSNWTFGKKSVTLKSVKITLDFPEEYIHSILGYTGRDGAETVVRSLTIRTNLRTYPTYGTATGEYFQIPSKENHGKIVGFHGTSGTYLNSIGARLQPF